ncbi:hypothetical protein BB560_005375 [Smittium megazygosporum]|uniref:Pyruvate kinase n=1 Tax=Smittium megazygosporum TaxID=133381 RepID=A0A2T9Z6Q3_9FUNG|nr:hypothetical protein BB560_005375 [Smittium megazygosporum]
MSHLAWNASLSIAKKPLIVRKSSIICTIGPATQSVDMIKKLLSAGMNIVRMNFSHGSHEYHAQTVANVRLAESQVSATPVAIALDTKGPEIRTGNMKDGDVPYPIGHEMIFSTDPADKDQGCLEKIYIDYVNIPKVVSVGGIVYIDDGIMEFRVLEIHDTYIKVRSVNSGTLSSHKGVNLPGAQIDLPALSPKDTNDLHFCLEQGLDMVFASFIRKAQDIVEIRNVLGEKGKYIKIIAKIESTEGVENFDSILAEADGIMIARGDLGIEIPAPKVFLAQKSMISKCNIAGKPVICATQMLESMTQNPRPTRAEVSDVANAILDGADCVMLSGETAKGKYPIEAVTMMSETAVLAEMSISYGSLLRDMREVVTTPLDTTEATCLATVGAAYEQDAKLIICLTTSGLSARMLSKYRPSAPILALTRSPIIARTAHLSRGCYPIIYNVQIPTINAEPVSREVWQMDVDCRIVFGINHAISRGLCKRGDKVIAIQGWRGGIGSTNTMRILTA